MMLHYVARCQLGNVNKIEGLKYPSCPILGERTAKAQVSWGPLSKLAVFLSATCQVEGGLYGLRGKAIPAASTDWKPMSANTRHKGGYLSTSLSGA